jgi:hypothetical protein
MLEMRHREVGQKLALITKDLQAEEMVGSL